MAYYKFTWGVLKNLFSKPATLMYPFKKREFFDGTRGHIAIEQDKCIYCGICAIKCPTKAIKVDREKKTWEIDPGKCIICGACTEACPKKCLEIKSEYSSAF